MGDLRKTIEQPVGKLPEDVGKPQPLPLKVGFSFEKPGYFATAVFVNAKQRLASSDVLWLAEYVFTDKW